VSSQRWEKFFGYLGAIIFLTVLSAAVYSFLSSSDDKENSSVLGINKASVPPPAAPPPSPAKEEKAPKRTVTKSDPTIDQAFKTLRKIMAATEVGVNMMEYGKLVIDAKAAMNDAIPNISDIELKKEVQESMQSYVDALKAWNLSIGDDLLTVRPNLELNPRLR
jgi:hypothetical protein